MKVRGNKMAEFHPELALSRNYNYHKAIKEVNDKYDDKIKNKSIFTTESSIEKERKAALRKVENNFNDGRGGGFFME